MTSQHSQPQADVAQLITDNVIAHAPYTVIACDPPWKFSNNGLADSSNQRYGELTLADLKGMGTAVKLLAAPDSVLLMWAVPALVPEAIELVRAWGYDYVTMIPWFKLTSSSVDDIANTINHHRANLGDPDYDGTFDDEPMGDDFWTASAHLHPDNVRPAYGMGWWARGCFEPLIIAKRGNPRGLQGYTNGHFVGLLSQNFNHSRKPDNVYDLGNQWPGNKLELFARRAWPGWVSTGLELDGRDVRDWLHDPAHLDDPRHFINALFDHLYPELAQPRPLPDARSLMIRDLLSPSGVLTTPDAEQADYARRAGLVAD